MAMSVYPSTVGGHFSYYGRFIGVDLRWPMWYLGRFVRMQWTKANPIFVREKNRHFHLLGLYRKAVTGSARPRGTHPVRTLGGMCAPTELPWGVTEEPGCIFAAFAEPFLPVRGEVARSDGGGHYFPPLLLVLLCP